MDNQLDTLLTEQRRFPPPPAFAAAANATQALYDQAAADPLAFWAEQARTLDWMVPWQSVLEWTPPHAKWFAGGRLNVAANCLDRHLKTPRRNKAAIIWEGEPGDRRVYTYWELAREVGRCASALKTLGVTKGDRVAIYLPMIPEAAIAMLACARIGAVHSVVFGGFSAEALRDRINDSQCTVLITADGAYRRGAVLPLKRFADEAIVDCPSVQHVIVVQRRPGGSGDESFANIVEGRDHWWHRLLDHADPHCPPEAMESEDMLFILYTSGTTGKPKGIVHTTGGYLTQVASTTRHVFDLRDEDVFWCTADVGWVTGHSYVVYGPLANGATVLMYEGAPDWPERDRFWKIIARYGVTVFYTAPTAIRAFMKWGVDHPRRHDLSTLRLLGSVGEPINPEAWMWYHEHIGHGRCPIVDTWWQTETGGIMITPLPGVTTTKPGSATVPYPGIVAELVDNTGKVLQQGGGFLT
ncbi:MAG TPA: acetate--CoA ligase, partial [Gemmatimonadales bacterium]|nr:acetate--CoA ligase [Gemmatimonadales bacterium]